MPRDGGLLMESDESDVPDLDLPTASRRTKQPNFFSKPRGGGGEGGSPSRRRPTRCLSPNCALCCLLFSIVVALAFLGALSLRFMAQIKQLQQLSLLSPELDTLKREAFRLRSDVDLIIAKISLPLGATAVPGVPPWNGTTIGEYISELERSIENLKKDIEGVDERCSRGCAEAGGGKSGESPRGKVPTGGAAPQESFKTKRSKSDSSFHRDTPIVFTRANDQSP